MQNASVATVASLILDLSSDDPMMNVGTICMELGFIGDPRAVEPLIDVVARRRGDYSATYWAAVSLSKLGDVRAVEPLIVRLGELLCGPESWERSHWDIVRDHKSALRAVAEALGTLRDPRVFDPLMALLDHQEVDVKCAGTSALGVLGDLRAASAVLQLLGDDAQEMRSEAIKTLTVLAKVGGPDVVDALVRLLSDPSNRAQMGAIGALRAIADPRSVDPLIQVLEGGDFRYTGAGRRGFGCDRRRPGGAPPNRRSWGRRSRSGARRPRRPWALWVIRGRPPR